MKHLTTEEEQWLQFFALENDFFQSLLIYYYDKGYLSYRQHYCLIHQISHSRSISEEMGNNEVMKPIGIVNESETQEEPKPDDYKIRFKEIQKRGKLLQAKYKKESKIENKTRNSSLSTNHQILDESRKSEVKKPIINETKFFDKDKDQSYQDELMNKKHLNFTDLDIPSFCKYSFDGNILIVEFKVSNKRKRYKISAKKFFNSETNLFTCKCGVSWKDINNLFFHLFASASCLNSYFPWLNELIGETKIKRYKTEKYKQKKQVGLINPIDSDLKKKAKYIFIDNHNHRIDECSFVIDGANVARDHYQNSGTPGGRISNINKLIEKLDNYQINNYLIICDRSLNYTIDDSKEYIRLKKKSNFIETPGGTEADHFILKYANDNNSFIISNDLFREFESIYGKDWIRSRRISFKFINDKLYFDKIYTSV